MPEYIVKISFSSYQQCNAELLTGLHMKIDTKVIKINAYSHKRLYYIFGVEEEILCAQLELKPKENRFPSMYFTAVIRLLR